MITKEDIEKMIGHEVQENTIVFIQAPEDQLSWLAESLNRLKKDLDIDAFNIRLIACPIEYKITVVPKESAVAIE